MMGAHARSEGLNPRLNFFCSAVTTVIAALLLGLLTCVNAQENERRRQSRPARIINIEGQVSLPEGVPAGRALVTLITGAGVPRQTYTTEQGRFEFSGLAEGGYTLSAKSLGEPLMISESVETDTSRTATGRLSVTLILRKETAAAVAPRPEIITVAEADQKVPNEARKAFKAGIKFRSDNELGKALTNFSLAVEIYPEYFQALTERGDILVLQRKLTEAAADFASALKVNPLYGRALRGAGYCKLEKREFAEAVKDLERAVTAQPDNASTHLLLGIAYLELDRRESARAALLKALSFNSPNALRAHIYLGNLFARQRLYMEAADELHKYLEANPTAPDAANLKAIESQWRALVKSP